MARPKKHPHERRSEEVKVRFTLAEAAHLEDQAEACGLSRTAYIRQRSLGQRIVTPQSRGIDPALIGELNRLSLALNAIGNNVNQISRNLNSGRRMAPGWEAVPEALQDVLKQAEDALDAVVNYGS